MTFHRAYRIFLAVMLLGVSACDKPCAPLEIVEIKQEMKDWTAFKPGSYWIYQDSISGAFDSISVYDFEYKVFETYPDKGECPALRQRQMNINFGYDSSYLNYEFIGDYIELQNGSIVGEVRFRSKRHKALMSPYLLFPIEVNASKTYGSKSHYTTESIIPFLRVRGQNYTDVVCTHDTYSLVAGTESRFYHVKNRGVVKKVYYKRNTDTPEPEAVWELIASEVYQD